MKRLNLALSAVGVLRLLGACVIWGIALFFWFSLSIWAVQSYVETLKAEAKPHLAPLQRGLANIEAPLEKLATNPVLQAGLAMPTGVESLPVQRALNMSTTGDAQTEIYVLDVQRQIGSQTEKASLFPSEVMVRLAALPPTTERTFVGVGKRSGLMYVARRVASPDAQFRNIWVVMSQTLPQMASAWPKLEIPDTTTLALLIPHASTPAGMATWSPETMAFQVHTPKNTHTPLLTPVVTGNHIGVPIPLPAWDDLYIMMETPFGAATWLGPLRLLVLCAACAATIALFWKQANPIRRRARAKLEPIFTPLWRKIRPLPTPRMQQATPREQEKRMETAPSHSLTQTNTLPELPTPLHTTGNAPDAPFDGFKSTHVSAPHDTPPSAPSAIDVGPPPVRHRWKAPTPTADTAKLNHPVSKPDLSLDEPQAQKDKVLTMKGLIEKCIAHNRIELHYQPIYRVEDSMPVLHEVFLRLIDEQGELVMPGDFLDTAIQFGLTMQLDLAVVKKIQTTFFVGHEAPSTPLALNISSSSLEGLDYLKETVKLGPRVLQKLALEVRSQEMIRDPRAMKLLKEIQRYGGHLAVDYFGGGANMLEAAKTIGFDYVKLDTGHLLKEAGGAKELEHLCHTAALLGLPVILEKVGDISTETLARKAGATYMQGFGLCKPKKSLTTVPLAPRMAGLAALVDTATQ